MENIFENAYFGKPYKTRDGRKAIYLKQSKFYNSCHKLISEDIHKFIVRPNGRARMDDIEIPNDIVGEWKEEEPSDEIIMLILNCIGYEEESWIEFVRKELKKRKYDTRRNNQEVAK